MKLRALIAAVTAVTVCLGLVAAASAGTSTKTAAGPGLNIRADAVATTTFTGVGIPGRLIDVNVSINGISHTYPEDIEATLTGPNGASVALMSDAANGDDVSGINLTFDDSAGASLPFAPAGPPTAGTTLVSGTYKPTNHVGIAPDNEPLTSTATTLSALTGGTPNGNYVLRVTDDFPVEDETGSYTGSSITLVSQFKKKCKKKKKVKKGAVAAKKCKKKAKKKMVLTVR